MHICKVSSPVKRNLDVSKLWSCRTSKQGNRIVELSNSTQRDLRKSLIVSIYLGFVDIAAQCLKQLVAFIITVIGKGHNLLYLKKTFNMEEKQEMDEMRKHYFEQKT